MMRKKMKFVSRTFKDRPRYCRVPIYLAGERQIHMMQPHDFSSDKEIPRPKAWPEWVSLMGTHGQVVISLEAVDDLCAALKAFRDELEKVNGKVPKEGPVGGE